MSRGQLTIIGIFGLSLLAVLGSLAWRYHETRHVLDFWGAEAATLIAQAERVAADRLEAVPEAVTGPGDSVVMLIDGQMYAIRQTKDVSDAPGFTHARHALTLNRSFEWEGETTCAAKWTYALRFEQGEKSAVVLIDPHCRFVRLLDGDKLAVLNPTVADGLAIILNEQFASRETSVESTTNRLENGKGEPQ
jgi:hypothetical protein